jgi:deazaflavin-dependent oxidoreductase (nitroreductase family)
MSHRTVTVTTTGRRSGEPRRMETWLWLAGERAFLTGPPGRRSWYANLRADPRLRVDGREARGRVITDAAERAEVFAALGHPEWAAERAPLIEVLDA